MSIPRPAPPMLLVAAITTSPEVPFREVTGVLEAEWGPVSDEGPLYDFDSSTHYYAQEMGTGLHKRIVAFSRPVDPERLPDIKLVSNGMEARWQTADGKRRANIDPGYLCPLNLVLASGKAATYRIYLRDGIYAEITLRYEHGSYVPLNTTYPDYRLPENIAFLNGLRPRALEVGRSTR